MKRRNLIKSLSILPFTAAVPTQLFSKPEVSASNVIDGENIFRLGREALQRCKIFKSI